MTKENVEIYDASFISVKYFYNLTKSSECKKMGAEWKRTPSSVVFKRDECEGKCYAEKCAKLHVSAYAPSKQTTYMMYVFIHKTAPFDLYREYT